MTFDAVIDANQDQLVDGNVTLLSGTSHAHPLFASGGSNNPYDVGVVVLDVPVAGTAFAPLPAIGALDTKAAKLARYTAVGYGAVRNSKSGKQCTRPRVAAGVCQAVGQLGHQELDHLLDEPIDGEWRNLLWRLRWAALQRRRCCSSPSP